MKDLLSYIFFYASMLLLWVVLAALMNVESGFVK